MCANNEINLQFMPSNWKQFHSNQKLRLYRRSIILEQKQRFNWPIYRNESESFSVPVDESRENLMNNQLSFPSGYCFECLVSFFFQE